MLKEICITPQVFDNEHLDKSNWLYIKFLLETIKNSGYILGLNNSDWYKKVLENTNKLESEEIKEKLISILCLLKDRGRIRGHPKSNINPLNEDDWIEIIKNLDEIRAFYSIIATEHYLKYNINIKDLEDIDISEFYGVIGSHHSMKSEQELESIFLPLLSYARKLTIIDPYFYIHEERYETTLKLISKLFKERRGVRDKGNFTINCKWDEKIENKFNKWQKLLNDIFQDFGHIITIQLWSRKANDELKLHERYLITESAGLYVGAGADKDDYQQSEWGLKEYYQLDEIRSQYLENAGVFKLEYVITSSSIRKKNE